MGSGTTILAETANRDAVARAFVEARKARSPLTRYPGTRPGDLESAYAIQDAAIGLWAESVGGWKVGRINAPLNRQLGSDRLAGPVPASRVVEVGSDQASMAIIPGGFAAGEAEFMIRLAPPAVNAPQPTDDAETLEWIDAVRIGIEIAASPYPGINADGPCVTISDHGNNLGLVLGDHVPADRWMALGEIVIESFIESERVASATARDMLDGPLGAVRFLLGNLAERGILPQPGWWISTGAVTGVHQLRAGESFRARFEGIGELACRVEI